MSLDKKYLKEFIFTTEMAAYGAFKFVGKGDKIAADQGAVDAMRKELNKMDIDGEVVIGEGEMDEAPMLYIGEKVGTKKGQKIDIALDPLEGTNFAAKNLPNALSVLAATEKGMLLSAPDTYMEKIAVGSGLPKKLIDLDYGVEKNIKNLAEAKNINPEKLNACVLDRPRHKKIIESLKKMKVNINFISDGDVYGVISTIDDKSNNDIYLGIGGGPEGVLAAAALSCLGGQMQTRLVLDDEQKKRAKKIGIKDLKRKYNIDDMVKGDVIFCATGITNGDLVNGVINKDDYFETSTFTLHKSQNFKKRIVNKHYK